MTEIAVVLRRLPAAAGQCEPSWLHPSERARLARIGSAARRRAYLAGHALARELLAARYGGAANDWPLEERSDAAPRVLARPDLALGISHSGDWVACAAGPAPLGVDIEAAPRRRSLARLAPLLLADDERTGGAAPDDDLLLDRWVLKEAWLKRDGAGVGEQRLRALTVRPGRPHATDLVLWHAPALRLALTCRDPAQASLDAPLAFAPPQRWRVA